MNPRFFIDRPIFAWVVALCILPGGVLTLRALPIEQNPTVAPPSLTISAPYPGDDAAPLAPHVPQEIQQVLNVVEHLTYTYSPRILASLSIGRSLPGWSRSASCSVAS